MSDPVHEPTELVYLPAPSWAPPIVAVGIVAVATISFAAWYWAVLGALILLYGLRVWWRQSDDEISHMRREQETDTAVIPAEPIRRSADGDS